MDAAHQRRRSSAIRQWVLRARDAAAARAERDAHVALVNCRQAWRRWVRAAAARRAQSDLCIRAALHGAWRSRVTTWERWQHRCIQWATGRIADEERQERASLWHAAPFFTAWRAAATWLAHEHALQTSQLTHALRAWREMQHRTEEVARLWDLERLHSRRWGAWFWRALCAWHELAKADSRQQLLASLFEPRISQRRALRRLFFHARPPLPKRSPLHTTVQSKAVWVPNGAGYASEPTNRVGLSHHAPIGIHLLGTAAHSPLASISGKELLMIEGIRKRAAAAVARTTAAAASSTGATDHDRASERHARASVRTSDHAWATDHVEPTGGGMLFERFRATPPHGRAAPSAAAVSVVPGAADPAAAAAAAVVVGWLPRRGTARYRGGSLASAYSGSLSPEPTAAALSKRAQHERQWHESTSERAATRTERIHHRSWNPYASSPKGGTTPLARPLREQAPVTVLTKTPTTTTSCTTAATPPSRASTPQNKPAASPTPRPRATPLRI